MNVQLSHEYTTHSPYSVLLFTLTPGSSMGQIYHQSSQTSPLSLQNSFPSLLLLQSWFATATFPFLQKFCFFYLFFFDICILLSSFQTNLFNLCIFFPTSYLALAISPETTEREGHFLIIQFLVT